MEARSADALPDKAGWWFEPKWDGFRCLAYCEAGAVSLQAKSGKLLTRYFPEVAQLLANAEEPLFVLDGELLVAADGVFSFEALQMRLHPAQSRIKRLAADTPAQLVVFDMLLAPNGEDLRAQPQKIRRRALEAFVQRNPLPGVSLTPGTEDRAIAQGWLDQGVFEGVVAKRLDGPYAKASAR